MQSRTRKHKYIGIVLVLLLLIVPSAAYAGSIGGLGTKQPIGGRILSGPSELSEVMICAASYGPFLMQPFNLAIPGPFFIRTAMNMPRVGGFLIGLYSVTPDTGTCYNPETGAPIPAFEVTPYNVSR